ncbi:FUSC family protein [Acidimangrovimonas sediminis]|uniref:FUSC family protein n=1 Tax=Acidimangrovimonas sediminis TaxID=2056283 RepID=UPI000C80490A|nr:FUSC family protein [Acidimangrovimonas sediminis]
MSASVLPRGSAPAQAGAGRADTDAPDLPTAPPPVQTSPSAAPKTDTPKAPAHPKAPAISTADALFSIKAFIAAGLAFSIACAFNLENPYWALGCVYLVSNPLSGASTSKAVYRLLGTVIGGVMTIAILPILVAAPTLFILVVGAWIALCLFVSLLDGTPRSYAFMLGGYTVALVAFTIVDDPTAVFPTAVARVEEIAIGVICAALVNRLIFPRHVGPVLFGRVNGWLDNAAALAAATLRGAFEEDAARAEIRRLAGDATDMRNFTTHISYDTSHHRDLVDLSLALQSRMTRLLPILSAVHDQIRVLEELGTLSPEERALLGEIADWIEDGATDTIRAGRLTDDVRRISEGARDLGGWSNLVHVNLAERLNDVVTLWGDCALLRAAIASGRRLTTGERALLGDRPAAPPVRDRLSAGMAGLAAFLAVVISATLWRVTGWSDGGIAMAQLAPVFCCILGAIDNPVPAMRGFLKYLIWAMVAAFVYEFALLPQITGIVPLVAALGLYLLPAGVLMARPATATIGLTLCVNFCYMLLLKANYSPNLSLSMSGNIGTIMGMVIAMSVVGNVRSIGADVAANRVLRRAWARIADATRPSSPVSAEELGAVLVDALGQAAPRLAQVRGGHDLLAGDILRDLRVGLNLVRLKQLRPGLSAVEATELGALLARLSTFYATRRRHDIRAAEALVEDLDAAARRLNPILAGRQRAQVLAALTGIRLGVSPAGRAPVPLNLDLGPDLDPDPRASKVTPLAAGATT